MSMKLVRKIPDSRRQCERTIKEVNAQRNEEICKFARAG
jgi:hypothetical protein